ncbi:MAG: hypothetical protein IKD96_05450 [Oscillospiraceae bacterium]|nr:hypothetical protein [Oscillospiraceae bacterium]
MKKLCALALVLALALCLAACGGGGQPDPNLGKYNCVSVEYDGEDLGSDGEWLELRENGECSLFLIDSPDDGTWKLNGSDLTLTFSFDDGDVTLTGTLAGGIATLDIEDLICTFVQEGSEAEELYNSFDEMIDSIDWDEELEAAG